MISVQTVYTALIAKSESGLSSVINLSNLPADGKMLLDLTITGDGTAKAEYLVCDTVDGTFIEPSGATDICTGHTKVTGASGRNLYKIDSWTPFLNKFMKIKITETGGVNTITPTVKLVIWAGSRN